MILYILILLLLIILYNSYNLEKCESNTLISNTLINNTLIDNNYENMTTFSKPYMWVYWELVNGAKQPPEYISLCMDIMKKNASSNFNIIFLNEKTVFNYLPDLRKDINDLYIALKTDYIRVSLLKKYGGLWVDADTIIMTDLREIAEKLNLGIDYIGVGCTGAICKDQEGYGKPSNGIMGSVINGRLISRCLNKLNNKLDDYYNLPIKSRKNFDYFDLGKLIIWDEYKKLKKEDKTYQIYHVPSYADGTRDIKGRWVAMNLIFTNKIKYKDIKKLSFVMLVNSSFCGPNTRYNWFCKLNCNEILTGNYFISELFNMALKYDPTKH